MFLTTFLNENNLTIWKYICIPNIQCCNCNHWQLVVPILDKIGICTSFPDRKPPHLVLPISYFYVFVNIVLEQCIKAKTKKFQSLVSAKLFSQHFERFFNWIFSLVKSDLKEAYAVKVSIKRALVYHAKIRHDW